MLPDIDALGRGVKLRIVVDKVMQPVEGWVTKEWMVKAAADAGFNVYSPRIGFDRAAEVRRAARWCAKYGIYFMPWMRGTLAAPMNDSAKGRRMVWANGTEQPLWSPNSDEFWTWTRRYIIQYAALSREVPSVLGVFLDYENYAPGKVANAYSLSFDDQVLAEFAKARAVNIPELPFGKRRDWLKKHGLSDAFHRFQVGLWRQRCRELRKAVDQINPKFRFCVYPAPGTPFIQQAVYPEWATKAAPLILADAATYGRPSRFIPQKQGLEKNRAKLIERRGIPRKAGISFIYLGGIDPVVSGADPEFCGKNAVVISDCTDGYWIFYEGPKYDRDHPHYWKWFTWANRAIAAGRLDAWREPREEPDTWFSSIFSGAGKGRLKIVPPPVTGKKVTYKAVHFRGEHLLVLPARKGQPVHVALQWHGVGHYESPIGWELRGPDGASLKKGKIPNGGSGVVQFTPKSDGMHLLAVSAGPCAWSVKWADTPVGVIAGGPFHLIGAPYRLYFSVPSGTKQFTLRVHGEGVETIRVRVRDPRNHVVAEGETSIQANARKITVTPPPGSTGAGAWCIETAKASTGVVEDNSIRLDPNLPHIVALDPNQLYRMPAR